MLRPDPDLPVEIFSVGTEVVLGRIQDTNSAWLAQQVFVAGGRVRRITAVPDAPDEMVSAFQDSIGRGSGLILSTGGLGPTPDDITVEIIATIAGCGVRPDPAALADYRVRRNIPEGDELNPNLVRMGSVPESAQVFLNPVGWAPGFAVEVGKSTIFCMPGPPREVMGIYEKHLAPSLAECYKGKTAAQRVRIEMFESQVSPLMQEVMVKFPSAYLKAYVAMSDGTGLPVDVVVRGADGRSPGEELARVLEFFSELAQVHGKSLTVVE